MAHFISDMRAAFGKPALPFAISAFGVAGFGQAEARRVEITTAQLNVANCTLHPELGCGTVGTAETRDVWRQYEETGGAINQNYHASENLALQTNNLSNTLTPNTPTHGPYQSPTV